MLNLFALPIRLVCVRGIVGMIRAIVWGIIRKDCDISMCSDFVFSWNHFSDVQYSCY